MVLFEDHFLSILIVQGQLCDAVTASVLQSQGLVGPAARRGCCWARLVAAVRGLLLTGCYCYQQQLLLLVASSGSGRRGCWLLWPVAEVIATGSCYVQSANRFRPLSLQA
ncbi:StAR-related lipid transfer protein 8 [Bienertia sinuspersici]